MFTNSTTNWPEAPPEEIHARERRGEHLRGAAVIAGAGLALVGIAYLAMSAITGPDGWATRAASDAFAGEAVLVSAHMPIDDLD